MVATLLWLMMAAGLGLSMIVTGGLTALNWHHRANRSAARWRRLYGRERAFETNPRVIRIQGVLLMELGSIVVTLVLGGLLKQAAITGWTVGILFVAFAVTVGASVFIAYSGRSASRTIE